MRFGFDKTIFCFQVRKDRLACDIAVHTAVFFRCVVIDLRIQRQDTDRVQLVSLSDRVVVEVVRRRDLHAAGTEFAVHVIIGDDRNLAICEWQSQTLADQLRVTLVLGMHRHRDVAQHGFRARGRDHHVIRGAGLRIDHVVADRPQVPIALDIVDFEVGHRGHQHRVPVHQPVAAIDQAGAVPLDEHLAYRGGQAFVHREAFARPVDACAQPAHLLVDAIARFLLPLPHAFDELLAAEVMARLAFRGQLVLDDLLRGDARVVGAALPQGVPAGHPRVSDQCVHDGLLERVAHVQRAGDVRRRQQDRIRFALSGRLEAARVFPARVPLRFDLLGVETLVHRGS